MPRTTHQHGLLRTLTKGPMSQNRKTECSLAEGATEEFIRPVSEIPCFLDIDLTMGFTDDNETWNRQPVSSFGSSR
jgi:hypothetical protein